MQSKKHASGNHGSGHHGSAKKPAKKPAEHVTATKASAEKAADKAKKKAPDDVQIASADSFPASDPPGWIDTEAHPVPPADDRSNHKKKTKD